MLLASSYLTAGAGLAVLAAGLAALAAGQAAQPLRLPVLEQIQAQSEDAFLLLKKKTEKPHWLANHIIELLHKLRPSA
jgi:hypothetical protein